MDAISCARCSTPIADASSAVKRDGQTYCCVNCMTAAGSSSVPVGTSMCAHCGVPIVVASTQVQGADRVYCCVHCATASAWGSATVREPAGQEAARPVS